MAKPKPISNKVVTYDGEREMGTFSDASANPCWLELGDGLETRECACCRLSLIVCPLIIHSDITSQRSATVGARSRRSCAA